MEGNVMWYVWRNYPDLARAWARHHGHTTDMETWPVMSSMPSDALNHANTAYWQMMMVINQQEQWLQEKVISWAGTTLRWTAGIKLTEDERKLIFDEIDRALRHACGSEWQYWVRMDEVIYKAPRMRSLSAKTEKPIDLIGGPRGAFFTLARAYRYQYQIKSQTGGIAQARAFFEAHGVTAAKPHPLNEAVMLWFMRCIQEVKNQDRDSFTHAHYPAPLLDPTKVVQQKKDLHLLANKVLAYIEKHREK